MKVLFCNIGWMEKYQGDSDSDRIKGGGAYVTKNETGFEIYNFKNINGMVYGYVQPPGSGEDYFNAEIKIERLAEEKKQDLFIDDVLVIWTATRPKELGKGTTVVGWYKHAKVFRRMQKFNLPLYQEKCIEGYRIAALADDVVLLPLDARIIDIPRRVKGAIGQSNIWYADKEESKPYREKALRFIEDYENPTLSTGRNYQQDQDKKAKVEKAAIQTCCAYFEKLGYTVQSVEKDNVGWDLIARADKFSLRIEVKGLSGSVFSIELTPKEYKAFEEQAEDYRLAVVVNALENPILSICRYSKELKKWLVETHGENDRFLDIKIKQSATIGCL
ncbi:DUF3883 domain-containing protein [Uruburuella suis]|uniref:DUF3883 domain-containing protein n=1 Tax=Uruburuella suis TaxID=252130 RepID=UPI003F4A9320